jgi:hypothetical protein
MSDAIHANQGINEEAESPILDDDRSDNRLAKPTRMVFCTMWRLRDGELDILDAFGKLEAREVPFEVTESDPIFTAIFWEGFSHGVKPLLSILTPSQKCFRVVLPSLKRFAPKQVQMNSLVGFCFREKGLYSFSVSWDGDAIGTRLTIA